MSNIQRFQFNRMTGHIQKAHTNLRLGWTGGTYVGSIDGAAPLWTVQRTTCLESDGVAGHRYPADHFGCGRILRIPRNPNSATD